MKKSIKILSAIMLVFFALFFISCKKSIDTASLWESALYKENASIGEGANSVSVIIEAGEKSVVLTVNTDKSTLGEALYENSLVNDASFFDTCNGIKADFNKDGSYWSFYVDGALASYGIGSENATTAEGAPEYKLVYTK